MDIEIFSVAAASFAPAANSMANVASTTNKSATTFFIVIPPICYKISCKLCVESPYISRLTLALAFHNTNLGLLFIGFFVVWRAVSPHELNQTGKHLMTHFTVVIILNYQ